MRLILVRHGDAHAGLHGVIAGPRGCRGLTDLGRRQAALLRERFEAAPIEADVLMTSELPRAIETAQIIAPGLGMDRIPRDCDLCEVHTGEADGMEWVEYRNRYGSVDMAAEPDRVFAPGGDSWNSFNERVHRTMHRLATDHPDGTVVAVCHAGVIAASMTVLLAIPPAASPARLRPTNTGLTVWGHDTGTGRWTLEGYNDTSHLGLNPCPDRSLAPNREAFETEIGLDRGKKGTTPQ